MKLIDGQEWNISYISKLYVIFNQIHSELETLQQKVDFVFGCAIWINLVITNGGLDIEGLPFLTIWVTIFQNPPVFDSFCVRANSPLEYLFLFVIELKVVTFSMIDGALNHRSPVDDLPAALPMSSFDLEPDVSVEFFDQKLRLFGAIIVEKNLWRRIIIKLLEAFFIILKQYDLQLRQEIEIIQLNIIGVSIKVVDKLLGAENIQKPLITRFHDLVWVDDQPNENENWDKSAQKRAILFIPSSTLDGPFSSYHDWSLE